MKPHGWISGLFSTFKKTVGWYTIDSTLCIKPNELLGGFSFTSDGLPIISNSYCRGNVPFPVVSEDPDSIVGDNIFENSVIKRTIAPKTIPIPFEPLTFIDSMIEMGNEADTLTWLGSSTEGENVWLTLKNNLENIKNLVGSENYKSAIDQIENFLSAVNEYYKNESKLITDEGYALMYYNGKYVLEYLKQH